MKSNSTYKFDFLVIGSGIAGLYFALKVAKHGTVAIVTKKEKSDSNTNYAQGGVAAVLSNQDSFDSHIKDTLDAAAGLAHKNIVEILVKEGPEKVKELISLGVEFTKKGNELDFGKEGGHSTHRIVHAADLTGKEIERALLEQVSINKNITTFENHTAIDLLTDYQLLNRKNIQTSNCYGAYVFDNTTNEVKTFLSSATLLSTGGLGQVYLHTTNPKIATGDGIAMAYRAGAEIANLEFIQFHPTTLYNSGSPSFLISEAVRGFGAKLFNSSQEEFAFKFDKRGALAPRDIVARAIDSELKRLGDDFVLLDLSFFPAEIIIEHFPNIYKRCLSQNIDITKMQIPVVPAAHYSCGGVSTNEFGETTINNLFASGEVTMTGVHGANRLASNSLLEALVFSHRAAEKIISEKNNFTYPEILEWDDSGTINSEEWILISHNKKEIQQLMWDYVGIVRSNFRLERAKRRIDLILNEVMEFYRKTKIIEELIELRNLAIVAQLIIYSALLRKESRGLHFTTDYPNTREEFKRDTIISRFV
ncbi:MAG: L-aspartate oxidase [Bacteroidota bacterium]